MSVTNRTPPRVNYVTYLEQVGNALFRRVRSLSMSGGSLTIKMVSDPLWDRTNLLMYDSFVMGLPNPAELNLVEVATLAYDPTYYTTYTSLLHPGVVYDEKTIASVMYLTMARDPIVTFDSVELKLKEYLSSYLVTSGHYPTLTVSAVSTYLSNSGYDYLLGEHSEFIKKCQDDLNNTDGLLFGNLRYLPSLQHGLQKSLFAMASNRNELTVANIDVKMTGGKKKRRSRKRTPKRSSKKRSSKREVQKIEIQKKKKV